MDPRSTLFCSFVSRITQKTAQFGGRCMAREETIRVWSNPGHVTLALLMARIR